MSFALLLPGMRSEDVKAGGAGEGRKPTSVWVVDDRADLRGLIRNKPLVQTGSQDLLALLRNAKVSEAHYLRRLHNLAVGLGWLPMPVLAPRLWPRVEWKDKRGITAEEHERILGAERNAERRLYYQLLWEVGASQSDAAALKTKDVDWPSRTLTYFRMKTGEQAQMAISKRLEGILNHLPTEGPLFPTLSREAAGTRAANFRGLCKRLKIDGVSLHSYRYAWAERAKSCGYPERFAQAALGHNSQAVHRAQPYHANPCHRDEASWNTVASRRSHPLRPRTIHPPHCPRSPTGPLGPHTHRPVTCHPRGRDAWPVRLGLSTLSFPTPVRHTPLPRARRAQLKLRRSDLYVAQGRGESASRRPG